MNPKQVYLLLLGFASGLPLALVGSALQGWFTVSGVDIVTIGFMGMVGQPYVYKFLWAPLFDRYTLPWLGRRRGWMFTTQVILLLSLLFMAQLNPATHPWWLGICALWVAVVSATQDVVVDAYRTDILDEKERGLGVATFLIGYRVAMLVSGGVVFIMADHWGWNVTYHYMALLMGLGLFATLCSEEPPSVTNHQDTLPFWRSLSVPFQEFWYREGALGFLLFMVIYKLGDAFAGSLTTTFLLRGAGFSLTDVGFITKTVGLATTLIGVSLGGALLTRMSLFYALVFFGLLQGVSNLTLMILAIVGKSYSLMVMSIGLENLCAGMGTAAFLTLLMALCCRQYSASQYALFSALSAVGRVFVGPIAGSLVSVMGWAHFFLWTFILSLPGIILLYWMREAMEQVTNTMTEQASYS
ncbi:MAG: AmpG family muropeptide MFS transporter [Gammaproteobacteria bacterium]